MLKIICLNIWGGHLDKKLISFFSNNKDVDIFCLQEVYHKADFLISDEERYHNTHILDEIMNEIPNHAVYFKPVVNGNYGIAILIRKGIKIEEESISVIHENYLYKGRGPSHHRILQYMKLNYADKNFCLVNLHGLWNGKGKGDSSARLEQAQLIREFTDKNNTGLVMCGDFNLKPGTKSLDIIKEGFIDHIELNNITSTRTSYYEKQEKYADYLFTSKDVKVSNFKVMPEEVSDHSALYFEIS